MSRRREYGNRGSTPVENGERSGVVTLPASGADAPRRGYGRRRASIHEPGPE